MTKPYHLTQEQALEILAKTNVPIEQVELFSSAEYVDIIYLHDVINAVLDKVLGEPVARLMLGNMQSPRIAVDINNPMKPVFCEPLLEVGTELYAPRREK